MKISLKRFLSGVLAVSLATTGFVLSSYGSDVSESNVELRAMADTVTVHDAKGAQEAAYIEWAAFTGTDHYYVDYSSDGTNFTTIDDSLVRQYSDRWRADVVGLKAGNYTLRVRCVNKSNVEIASATKSVSVVAHDRRGFTFDPTSTLYHTADPLQSGAYNGDGTLKSNADVIYITSASDIDNVTYGGFTGLSNILENRHKQSGNPLCVRFLGKIDYSGDQLNGSGYIQVKPQKAYTDINTTIEGIGADASLNFGILCRNAGNVEIRNLAIHDFKDDGISLDTSNCNIWIHNNEFFYGVQGSGDKVKGDGSTDVKGDSRYVTLSYNHYWDGGKVSLCGMKSETGDNFISYHHNWFDHSDSRMPRVRTMSVHVFNNYYDGCSKYGVGVSAKSNAFVENNYFRNTKNPTLQGSAGQDRDTNGGSKTFDDSDPTGAVKMYGNYITGELTKFTPDSNGATAGNGDACVADSRSQVLSYTTIAGATYNNFDTKSNYIQSLTPDSPETARDLALQYAGRVGQEFKFTFTAADDASSDINTNLRSQLTSYMANKTLVSVGGASDGSGPVEITTTVSTTTESTTETTTEAPIEITTVASIEQQSGFLPENTLPDSPQDAYVSYNSNTDEYRLVDDSTKVSVWWENSFEPLSKGKVVVRGHVRPRISKATSKWAFLQVRGKTTSGAVGEIASLASDENKILSLRTLDRSTASPTPVYKNISGMGEIANQVYNYVFTFDMDAQTVELDVNGVKTTTNVDVAEISSVYFLTAVSAADRDIDANIPEVGFYGVSGDEPTPTPTPEPAVIYGNADNNDKLTASDGADILQRALRAESITNAEKELDNGFGIIDVNLDGKITSADAAYVLQKVLDGSFLMPCEKTK